MSARIVLVLFLVLLGGVGCRSLIEPDALEQRRDVRFVDGRFEDLEAPFEAVTLTITRNRSYDEDFEMLIVSGDADGRFRIPVAAGTVPRVDIRAVWDDPSRIVQWDFENVEVRDEIVLVHRVQRLAGRIETPAGLASATVDSLSLGLVERRPIDGRQRVFIARGSTPIDAAGRFEAWVPAAQWTLRVDLRDVPGISNGMTRWEIDATRDGLVLPMPLERGFLTVASPPSIPDDLRFSLERFGFEREVDGVFTEIYLRHEVDFGDRPWNLWLPAGPRTDFDTWNVSRVDGGYSLGNYGVADVTEQVVDGIRSLSLDLGPHLLTCRIREDGEPSVFKRLNWTNAVESGWARTDSTGVAYVVADPGVHRIGITREDGIGVSTTVRVPQELDVTIDLSVD